MAKLTWEDRMTIKSLTGRQCSNRHIARLLGVSEGTVRYHRRRQAAGAADGRSGQQPVAARFDAAIDAYVLASGEESPSNVAALHAWLVVEHDYPAGLRSVQRYVRRAYPVPARRTRRRMETPPGVQLPANTCERRTKPLALSTSPKVSRGQSERLSLECPRFALARGQHRPSK